MRKVALALFVLSAAVVLSVSATGQPPEQKGGQGGKGGFGGKGGPGGGGFGMRPQPGQIMPPFLAERLRLSADQKKQLADLQKDVDAKLDKLLTDEQKAELKKMREQGPGGFPGGPGGAGGFPGGRDKGRGPGQGGAKGPPKDKN